MQRGVDLSHAYLWMAEKLSEKTGIWQQDMYGILERANVNENGNITFEDSEKIPLLPFWGWYLVNGENKKPGMDYCFDSGDERSEYDWNKNDSTVLIEMDIPEQYVLLSDANAWYCVLEGRPCYEYETRTTEIRLMNEFTDEIVRAEEITDEENRTVAFIALTKKMEKTWDNIFRLKGRRLRKLFPFGNEAHDVQAVFPYIDKTWIKNVWECH